MKEVSVEKAAKLFLICQALDKQIRGLNKPVNMLDEVRWGGSTLRGIKEKLDGSKS